MTTLPPTTGTDAAHEDDSAGAGAIGRAQVRGSVLLVLGRVTAMLLAMATQVVIVRTLSKEDFGAFAYAFALATAARSLLSLGQGRLLSRFLAGYEEEGDTPRMFGAIALAVGTIVATSTLFIAALYLFDDQIIGSALNSHDAITLVLILVFLSPIEAIDQVFVSLFAVFSKPTAIFFRKYLIAPGLRLVVVLLLVLFGAGVTFLAAGYVLAAAAGIALYCALLVKPLRERGLLDDFRSRGVILPYRAVFGFSLPLITGEFALMSFTAGGVIILGLFHGSVEVANYQAVFSSARLNTAVQACFATLFLPMIARLHARGDLAGMRDSYWHTATFVAVFTFPVFALTGPLAPATTETLFGTRYAASATILSILAVGYYVNVILGFNAYALQVCGRLSWLVYVNAAVAVGNVALCFALAPEFGAVGVAAANCVALLGQNLFNQWALRSSLDTGLIGRSCRGAYAAIALGALLLWGFQWLVSPGLLGSLVAGALVSIAVLLASQRALQLGETFPELRSVPVVKAIIR